MLNFPFDIFMRDIGQLFSSFIEDLEHSLIQRSEFNLMFAAQQELDFRREIVLDSLCYEKLY